MAAPDTAYQIHLNCTSCKWMIASCPFDDNVTRAFIGPALALLERAFSRGTCVPITGKGSARVDHISHICSSR